MDLDALISKTAKEVVSELKKSNMLKENKQTPFQKTETLLYNYNNFKQLVEDKYNQIKMIQEDGVPKKSSSITSFTAGNFEVKCEMEKCEDMIYAIMQSLKTTENFIKLIDDALDSISNDSYFEIIRLKYFEKQTREDIADYFDCDIKTVSRNKNRLINMLQIRLFSDEYIFHIFS